MARLIELEDEADTDTNSNRTNGTPGILTQAQREQVLFESGVLEKLGLPKDFVTLEEAQAQLQAQRAANGRDSASGRSAGRPGADRIHDRSAGSLDSDSDDDLYGNASDREYDNTEDTAEGLMREQEANEMGARLESSLDLLIWTMPFGFLYTLLDVLVRQQYGETIGFVDVVKRLGSSMPSMSLSLLAFKHLPRAY